VNGLACQERHNCKSPQLHAFLDRYTKGVGSWDHSMLWVCMCLYFFGFLRAGEAVIESDSSFDPSQHLSFTDIAVDRTTHPSFIRVTIKQSKTDPFRAGVDIIIGRLKRELSPVAAVLSYMAKRGPGPGLLFRFEDSWPLTHQKLVSNLQVVLQRVGIDCSKYSAHSFRIGVATTVAAQSVQDSLIKTVGHWESVAYQLYV